MTTALAPMNGADMVERVVMAGDLGRLSAQDRVAYYRQVCESVGLNPLTRPFDYITLQGKLTLYARKDATDQMRRIHRVSIQIAERERIEDVYVVTARATTPDGRIDESTGAVTIANLKGDALANALMKAETKAKRRVTLSICGMGWLDETELSTIADAQPTRVDQTTGEILDPPASAGPPASDKQRNYITGLQDKLGWHSEQLAVYVEQQGADLAALTAAQASILIEGLKALAEERPAKNNERPLVKRLRELVNECRGAGAAVPDLPKPRDMTDEQLLTAIAELEIELSVAQGAADKATDDLL